MLFNKLKPEATEFETIGCAGDEVSFCPGNSEKCSLCDNKSNWVSISFQCVFCSEECLAAMWKNYFECVRRIPVREDLADEF